jgi:hypothetical protein
VLNVPRRRRRRPPPDLIDRNAIDAIGENVARLHSRPVSRDREVVFESGYNGFRLEQPANTKSAVKSVVSTLVGIAIAPSATNLSP